MASKQSTVEYLVEQIQNAGFIRFKKMFGEYAVYCNEKVVALVCDDQLFIKPTPIGLTFLDESHYAPPYPGAKPYLKVPEEKWEDREWITQLVQQTQAFLPLKQLKKRSRNI